MLFAIFIILAYIMVANSKQFAFFTAAWLSPGFAVWCRMQLLYIFSRSNDTEILIKGSMAVSQHDVIPLTLPVELAALDAQ